MKITKKTHKGAALLLLSAALLGLSAFKIAEATHVSADVPAVAQNRVPASYSIYEPFGLRFDKEKDELTFEDEPVRYFYDGVDLGGGTASVYCEHLDENGTVDVYAVRKPAANKDGSTNPFGELVGIKRYSQEEFDKRDLSGFYGSAEAAAYSMGSGDPSAETFAERFEKYKEFGIEYVETGAGGRNVYHDGQLASAFIDISPSGGAFTFRSTDGGKIRVQTVYDEDGKLTGVKTAPIE